MEFTTGQYLLFFGLVALGTLLTRALPFLLFPDKKEIPQYITYLANILPYTMIGILVVYCLKNVTILGGSHGIPELVSIIAIVILHLWKNNALLSIGGGTLLYMLLVQSIF